MQGRRQCQRLGGDVGKADLRCDSPRIPFGTALVLGKLLRLGNRPRFLALGAVPEMLDNEPLHGVAINVATEHEFGLETPASFFRDHWPHPESSLFAPVVRRVSRQKMVFAFLLQQAIRKAGETGVQDENLSDKPAVKGFLRIVVALHRQSA
jgi:hypothetical protein